VCVRVCVALPLPALSFCVTADMSHILLSHILLVITMNSHCNIYTCVCTHNFVDIRMLQCQGAPPDAIHQNNFYMRTYSTSHLMTWVPQCQQVPPDDAHNTREHILHENVFYHAFTYAFTCGCCSGKQRRLITHKNMKTCLTRERILLHNC